MELGKKQKLMIVKKTDFGVYLADDRESGQTERVLLPGKQVPEGCGIGDELEVFLYRDSKDRMIATTRSPKAELGEVALFTVSQVGKIGAFLDWGLEKDLLLPFREQTKQVREGDEVLAAVYLDKSNRLCATMKVYHYLHTQSPYQEGDEVQGRIYQRSDNFGVFVAVDDKYSALIPKREAQGKFIPGELMTFRVTEVKEDGKLNLSARKKAHLQIEEDAENVESVIAEFAGVLPFDDKASPEVISREFGLSKAAFKRAVGHLLKAGRIEIKEHRIFLKK